MREKEKEKEKGGRPLRIDTKIKWRYIKNQRAHSKRK